MEEIIKKHVRGIWLLKYMTYAKATAHNFGNFLLKVNFIIGFPSNIFISWGILENELAMQNLEMSI